MSRVKNKLIIFLSITILGLNSVSAETEGRFNITNVMDSFLALNSENQETEENNENKEDLDNKSKIRKDFIDTTLKFNQGNASVAYDEYSKIIRNTRNDVALLSLAEVFYKIGFYSLAQEALHEIVYKNQYFDNISDFERSYKPKVELTKEDEIYFAKLYSDIYFNNSSQEVINELIKNKTLIKTNDLIDFTLARALFENKKYDDALNYINKAILINPTNFSYQMFKIDILLAEKKYKDAYKFINKMKKAKLPLNFINEFEIKNSQILAMTSNDEKEKKYLATKKSFLEGNYEKTKKECQNILNFDKDNDKIITLYAKSELALGKLERANSYFINSYKINRNNPETLVGIGDIRYIHGDYKKAIKSYKKALLKDKSNYEIILKLTCAHRQYAKKQKELNKYEQMLDKMPSSEYQSYYNTALSLAQKNDVLKDEFLKRSLNINPLDKKATGALVELYLQNKSYEVAKNLIYNTSYTLEKNYFYYYLCGLYNQALGKKKDAIYYYKTCLNLNPNFEIANIKLLDLIPSTIDEEI